MTWPKLRLQHLAIVVTRGSAPNYSESTTDYDARTIGQSCLRPDGSMDLTRARGHDGPVPRKGRVFGGEVLINSTGTGTLGRVALLPELDHSPTFVDGHVTMIRVRLDRCDARFLAYALGPPAFVALAEQALSVGSTKQRELNVDAVRRHAVCAPDVHTQREVADFLDGECDRIGSLVRRLRDVGPVSAEPALNAIESRWDDFPMARIGHRFEVQLGKKLYEERINHRTAKPYLRIANVYWDRFDLHDIKVMNFEGREAEFYELRAGDLLVCEGRGLGRSAVWSGQLAPCYFQMSLNRVRPYADDSTRWVMWCLRVLNRRGGFLGDAPGVPHVTAEQLRSTRIPLPSPERQQKLISVIDGAADRGKRLAATAEAMTARLTEYRQALISEAVTGQLDVRAASGAQMNERAHAAAEGAIAIHKAPAKAR